MEDSNPRLQRLMFEIVDNQLRSNDPPETRLTLDRLVREGHSDREAKRLIAVVVAVEIYDTLKHKVEFDRERFITNLSRLPALPFDNHDE